MILKRSRHPIIWLLALLLALVLASCSQTAGIPTGKSVVFQLSPKPVSWENSREIAGKVPLFKFIAELVGETTYQSPYTPLDWSEGQPEVTEVKLGFDAISYGDYELTVSQVGRPEEFPEYNFTRDVVVYTAKAPVTINQDENAVSLTLERVTATIDGRLTTATGLPLPNVVIVAHESATLTMDATSDANGYFSIKNLSTGPHTLEFTFPSPYYGKGQSLEFVLYDQKAVALGDTVAEPAPQPSGAPYITTVTSTGYTVHWDQVMLLGGGTVLPSQIRYKVVHSTNSSDLDNVQSANKLTPDLDWSAYTAPNNGQFVFVQPSQAAYLHHIGVLAKDGYGNVILSTTTIDYPLPQ